MNSLTIESPATGRRRGSIRLVAFITALAATVVLAAGSLAMRSDAHGGATAARADFQDAMRGLWEEHVAWTRMFIVSFVADVPDLAATTDRLLRNQADIGDAVRPFYGDAAADQLTALLSEHILGAAELLAAAKAGDTDGVATASEAWYANADEIADFLAAANPRQWTAADLRQMMKEHLDLTLSEAVAQLTGDYPAAIAAYDEVEVQIRHMADMLSDGIMDQFPARFAR